MYAYTLKLLGAKLETLHGEKKTLPVNQLVIWAHKLPACSREL